MTPCWWRCCARSKRASDPDGRRRRPVALRGFSWIVNPFEAGGVVIALELSLGAVVAGPFDMPERDLNEKIERVLDADAKAAATRARAHRHPTRFTEEVDSERAVSWSSAGG